MAVNVKTFDVIVQDEIDYMVANQDVVTDFNPGSVIRVELESVAIVIEDLYNRTLRRWASIFRKQLLASFDFEKKENLQATGLVTFSRAVSTPSQIIIPKNTLVATTDGVTFITTAQGVINASQTDSGLVPVQAVEAGPTGNVPGNSITVITTPFTGSETVNNPSQTTGGQFEESDEEHLARFSIHLAGLPRTTTAGIISGALEIDNVRSVQVVSGTCLFDVFVDDGTGSPVASLIDEVQAHLDENNDTPGTDLTVRSPTKVTITLESTVTMQAFLTGQDLIDEIELVKTAQINYINGLEIGDDVSIARLFEASLLATPNVVDIIFTDPDCENITILDGQVARTDSGNVTVN